MRSTIAATTPLKTFTHKPIPPKAAARFAVRAFCALLRFPTRIVRKPQAVATSGTIEPSHVRIETPGAPDDEGVDLPNRSAARDEALADMAEQPNTSWRTLPCLS